MFYLGAFNTKLSVFADKLVIKRSDTAASGNTRKWLGRPINIKTTTKNRLRFMFQGP